MSLQSPEDLYSPEMIDDQLGHGGHLGTESAEQLIPLSLVDRNEENLSIYTPEEELAELNRIAEHLGFPCEIVPIVDNDQILGYLVTPKDQKRQKEIIAEAPITLVDFDDTQGQTTRGKETCWKRTEELGIKSEIIHHCDDLGRIEFDPQHGEILEIELEMRLLTFALRHPEITEEILKEKLNTYLKRLLSFSSVSEMKRSELVDERIQHIFNETRFSVDLYPDTLDVLAKLRGSENQPRSNVFGLTYGDAPFQFQKTLPLLKEGKAQCFILTKAKKGPLLKALFKLNPFKTLNISYRNPERTSGLGIDPVAYLQPILLIDDDPGQVASVNKLAKELGIPLLAAWRPRSKDQKRFSVATIHAEFVMELPRDDDLNLTVDIQVAQSDLFASALENFFIGQIKQWQIQEDISVYGDELFRRFNITHPDFASEILQGILNHRLQGSDKGKSHADSLQLISERIIHKLSA